MSKKMKFTATITDVDGSELYVNIFDETANIEEIWAWAINVRINAPGGPFHIDTPLPCGLKIQYAGLE